MRKIREQGTTILIRPMQISFFVVCIILMLLQTAAGRDIDTLDECLLQKIKEAKDSTPIGVLKEQCRKELNLEKTEESELNPFVILPYRPNYLLVAAFNPSPNDTPFKEAYPSENNELDNIEVKFQISFMLPILTNIFNEKGNLIVSYTQRSFWQAYNTDNSSQFRENNFEPELFFSYNPDWTLFGWKTRMINTGYNHHSNGRGGDLSRSWNRLFTDLHFAHDRYNLNLSIKPWIIIGDPKDNPDIKDYMGYLELLGVYKFNRQTFSLMLRKKTFQIDWSFPLYHRLRGYIQYFNGYCESLIDYNVHTQSFGLGFQITEWH